MAIRFSSINCQDNSYGIYMAVVYAKYRSAERTSAGYLILSDLTPKSKLYSCICMRIDQHHRHHISDHDDFDALS
jgi:hypothetical protein